MGKRNKKTFDYFMLFIGVICITYFVVLLMNMSFTKFLLIYPMGTAFCFIYAGIELYTGRSNLYRIPAFFRYLISIFIMLGIVSFIAAESVIIYQGLQKYEHKSDYVIVLGAQVNNNQISASLKYRLDAALEIYEKYPDTIFVVSGGKGTNETDSEAQFMHDYLCKHNISENQIIMENRSTNTYENLLYSKQLLDIYSDGKDYDVTIVTNAFHTYRSKFLAENIGLDAHTYAADMHKISIPNFYIREFFGLVKDMAVNGNLIG